MTCSLPVLDETVRVYLVKHELCRSYTDLGFGIFYFRFVSYFYLSLYSQIRGRQVLSGLCLHNRTYVRIIEFNERTVISLVKESESWLLGSGVGYHEGTGDDRR